MLKELADKSFYKKSVKMKAFYAKEVSSLNNPALAVGERLPLPQSHCVGAAMVVAENEGWHYVTIMMLLTVMKLN